METNIAGYLVLEAKRHFLDLSEATDSECRSYGEVLRAVTSAIRTVTECARVYSFTLAEVVPHFHVHLIPRTNYLPPSYRGRGVLAYPLNPGIDANVADLVCERLRRAMRTTCSAHRQ